LPFLVFVSSSIFFFKNLSLFSKLSHLFLSSFSIFHAFPLFFLSISALFLLISLPWYL
jgi:hypothetical protein